MQGEPKASGNVTVTPELSEELDNSLRDVFPGLCLKARPSRTEPGKFDLCLSYIAHGGECWLRDEVTGRAR